MVVRLDGCTHFPENFLQKSLSYFPSFLFRGYGGFHGRELRKSYHGEKEKKECSGKEKAMRNGIRIPDAARLNTERKKKMYQYGKGCSMESGSGDSAAGCSWSPLRRSMPYISITTS